MPLWPKKGPDKTPPPEPKRKPWPHELSEQLLDAVIAKDTIAARKVMDIAFWEKVDFKPDSYHLLQAAKGGDRAMVTLLTSFGATWTTDEAKLAPQFIKPDDWKKVEGPLRQAGIRTKFPAEELKDIDYMASVRWAHRSVSHAVSRKLKDAGELTKTFDRVVMAALVAAGLGAEKYRIEELLLYRNKSLGAGTPKEPLNLQAEFDFIIERNIVGQGRDALLFLDTFRGLGMTVKPIEVNATHIIVAKDIVQQLEARGVLAHDSVNARRDVLEEWTSLQEKTEFDGFTLDVDKEDIEKQSAGLKEAVSILFGKDHEVTGEEAENFIRLHERRSKIAPYGLANAEKQLLEMGFFDGPAWTADRLRRLAAAGELPDPSITDTFNGMAARVEMGQTLTPQSLNAKKIALVEEGHLTGKFRANAKETLQIVDYLATLVKKDDVPVTIENTIKILVKGGADFSLVKPNKYLGASAPGLAKTLLDTGAVEAESFDMDAVAMKIGGGINLVIPPGEKGFAYNEFLCQLILEQAEPIKFIPQRGREDISYQKLFIKEWAENLSRRSGASTTYRKPKPPANGSLKK